MTFGGIDIRVAARIDASEISRRGDRWEPVTREALEALFVLPEHEPVGDSGLPSWVVQALASAPEWAVQRVPQGWMRTYRPPAHVAYVSVADWSLAVEDQLDELEWMSPIAPRVVVTSMDAAMRSFDLVRERAAGIATADDDRTPWTVLRPSPSRVRLTCHRWWLAERVADVCSQARLEG